MSDETDPFTMIIRMCDDDGMVFDTTVAPGAPGATLDPGLTYPKMFNNLRRHGGLEPYAGQPLRCTGSAHLASEHIRCTNPIHAQEFSPTPGPWHPATLASGSDPTVNVVYEYSAVVDRRIHGGQLEIARVRDNLERAETDGAVLALTDMYPVAVMRRQLPDGQWELIPPEEPKPQMCACGSLTRWVNSPTGGWYAHVDHSADNHDAVVEVGE